jgi:hypothetical protein
MVPSSVLIGEPGMAIQQGALARQIVGTCSRHERKSEMFGHQGIAVSSWVNLDSSCQIKPEVHGEQLQIEFGPRGSLGLVITEDMVDRLAVVFAEAKARFRELDEQAAREHGSVA